MSQWPKGFGDSRGDNSRKDLAAEKGCKREPEKNMMCNMNEEEIYIYTMTLADSKWEVT